MTVFYTIIKILFWIIVAIAVIGSFVEAIQHKGPDERHSRDRYNQIKD